MGSDDPVALARGVHATLFRITTELRRHHMKTGVLNVTITPRGANAHRMAVNDVLVEFLEELTLAELERLSRALRPMERIIGRWRRRD